MKTILRLSFPLVAAEIAISFNGFTDGLFLSRLSETALRASLPANMIAACVLAPITAALSYSGTLVAQACGGRRPAQAVAVFAQALWMTLASVPVFFAAIPVAQTTLALFGHGPDILGQERLLSAITLAGSPLTLASAVAAGFFSGQRKTRLVGAVTIAGAFAKIVLTPLLVFGIGPLSAQGIAGAGLAFVGSGLITSAIYLAALLRDPLARTVLRRPRLLAFRPKLSANILRKSGPVFASSVISTGAFMLTVSLIARLDALSAAASSAVFAINCPFNAVMSGIRSGIVILIGRHTGGHRVDEIARTLKASCAIASVLSLGYIALLAVFAHGLLRLFLSSDTPFNEGAFLACGTGIIVLLAVRIPIEFGGLIVQAALLGVGRTRALLDSSLQISAGVWVPLLALVTWLRPSAAAYWLTIAVHTLLRALVNLRSLRLHLPSAADTPDLKPVQLSKRRMRSASSENALLVSRRHFSVS